MEKNERNLIDAILIKNGFADVEEILIQDLANVVKGETFGNKVTAALNLREKGHFDKAMLNISKVNRDQVLSIRAIQSIIDKIRGVAKTEVILEKYRQFPPLQIGLTNGKDVLELLRSIRCKFDFSLDELVTDLHQNEAMVDPMIQELNFYENRMKGRISEGEINELKKNISKITSKVIDIKTSLIDCICEFIQGAYFQISIADKFSLIKSIYLILSSSVQTLDAKFVEIEKTPDKSDSANAKNHAADEQR